MKNNIKILERFENPDSNWRTEAEDNIRKYRMGDAKIRLVDKNGQAVPGIRIRAVQKTHEFDFGANIFMLDELETQEKNKLYKERFKELFNTATLPFYWEDTEPQKGSVRYEIGSCRIYRRPSVELCLKYCEENGIKPREHGLAFEACFPQWLCGLSVSEVKKELESHFREIGRRYASRIHCIEVTNEMLHGKGTGITPFYDEPDYVEWCFKTARKYFPNNALIINDGTWRMIDAYREYIEENLKKNTPIDIIGIQFHVMWPLERYFENAIKLYDPDYLKSKLDMFEQLEKGLELSEVTVPAFSNEPADEAIQATLIENLYTLWFAQPRMERIVYWNLVDGYAAFAPQGDMTCGENQYYGGLLRFDLSEKPAYKMLKKLIHEIWHTDTYIVTDENGEASFRGFYGKYELCFSGKKQSVCIYKNSENSFSLLSDQ